MRAAVTGMVAQQRRGTAYGVFNTGYGLAWFLGSALMGVLYDLSLPALIVFSVGAQALSLPLLIGVAKRFVKSPSPTQQAVAATGSTSAQAPGIPRTTQRKR